MAAVIAGLRSKSEVELAEMPDERQGSGVDRALVRELKNREDARFRAEHPRSAELLERGRRVMPN